MSLINEVGRDREGDLQAVAPTCLDFGALVLRVASFVLWISSVPQAT